MRRFSCLAFGLIAVMAACSREPDNALPVVNGDVTAQEPMPVAPKGPTERPAPSLRLRVYPDMAVPGREVVVKADIGSVISGEPVDLSFIATNDPCGGQMEQRGNEVTYKVPKDCRGSEIELTAVLKGDFGEVTKVVALEIKGATSSDSVVLRSPLPWEKVISPVLARWDRSLYQNRKETLQFKVSLQGMFLFGTPMLDPVTVVELDLPPSPEDVIVKASTSGESEENLTLKVIERKAPFFPPWARVVHDCRGENGRLAARLNVLDKGGETDAGAGMRFGTQGTDSFTYVYYHVGKKQRFDRKEAAMGIEFPVDGDASSAVFDFAHVWIKGDKTGGFASPLYVTISGNMGGQRRFKIVRARETWFDFRFPIKAALKEGKGEKITSISIYADARDVNPPLGLFLLGGIYLEPAGSPSGTAAQDLPPSGVEPEPGEVLPDGSEEGNPGAAPAGGSEGAKPGAAPTASGDAAKPGTAPATGTKAPATEGGTTAPAAQGSKAKPPKKEPTKKPLGSTTIPADAPEP